MGKELGKKKKEIITKRSNSNVKLSNVGVNSPRAYDMDTVVFISMAQEHKEEGNRLFQKRDYEGAMLKYEKALKLLPGNHIDVSHIHSNMAACYMQMGIVEYPRAIHECNLALEVTPKYTKALLKRARCYEGLNRLDLAFRDVSNVLKMEPNNVMAAEIEERLRVTMEKKGTKMSEEEISSIPVPEYVVFEPTSTSTRMKSAIEKVRKKKSNKHAKKNKGENEDRIEEKEDEDRIELKKYEDRIEEKKYEDSFEKKNKENVEEKRDKEQVDEEKLGDSLEKKNEKNVEEKRDEEQVDEEKLEDSLEKKNEKNVEEKRDDEQVDEEKLEEKKAEDKLVVEEKISTISMEEEPKRILKLVFGEDIRFAKVPFNCSILKLREIIQDRFPCPKAILIKYRDQEGDLVTITTNEELRWAEASMEQHGSVKLYIVEVKPDQDPFFGKVARKEGSTNGGGSHCIDDWIIQFAELFKNYVGFNSDAYLDLHELGMKVYSEAMEDAVTSEEAQELFNGAGDKFQEMAALALFNWGNVHLSKARKRVYFTEDASRESVLGQVKVSYDWAQKEYTEAGDKYEEALKIKPDFYEGVLALGQQQFEQAKLSWYYAVGTNVDLETWNSSEVLQLYNYAEDNMEKGMQMWEEAEKQRINEVSRPSKSKKLLEKVHSDGFIKDVTADEAAEQAANMRSQINLLWGTMLYERSIMEYKLGLPVWHECLEVAVEKFELAGASPTDIAVMVKNHCSNDTTLEGLGFNIDEIVQAWNEMYEAKRWQSGVPSFRLEPLLRRRVSKLYHALEHT